MTNNPDEAKGSRGDHLTATTPDGKIELTEEELKRASGGIKIVFTPSPLDAKAPVRGGSTRTRDFFRPRRLLYWLSRSRREFPRHPLTVTRPTAPRRSGSPYGGR
jgi:hypothetical protein